MPIVTLDKLNPLQRRVAQLVCKTTLDTTVYGHAVNAVNRKSRDFYDAFANAGQIPGNVQGACAVAIVYGWLEENSGCSKPK